MAGRESASTSRLREMHALIDFSPDPMVVVCADGLIRYVNRLAEELLGYREAELAGRPVELLVPEYLRAGHVGKRKRYAADPQARAMGLGLELVARKKDGQEIAVEISLGPVRLGGEQLVCCGLRDVGERRRANAATYESEGRFRDLVALSSDWYWEQDENFHFTRMQAGLSGAGSLQAAVDGDGKTRWELHAGSLSEEQWAAHRRQLEAHEEFHDFEFERLGRDGQMRWVSISGRPIIDEQGGFRGYRGVGRDITARKLAEGALRESEERFRAMAELTSDYYWEQDENLRFTKRMGMLWEKRSYPFQSVIGKTRWELPALNMTETDWARHRADLAARREFRDLEIERPLPSGEHRWVSSSGRPIFDAGGQFRGYRGVGQDITVRKRAELALREHERGRGALMRNLPGMVYRCANDPQWTMEFVSEGCVALTGYAPEDIAGNRTLAYADLIHEEDRDKVWSDVQAALAGRGPFELQYRIRAKDGTEKWVWEKGRGVYAASGELLALEGYVTDVTSRVGAEQGLREGVERLRLIADNVPAMIAYSDTAYRYRYANRQFIEFYSPEIGAVEGRAMAEVLGAAAYAAIRPAVERALGGQTVNYEVERRRADGLLRHVDVTLVPHRGDGGDVHGVYTFIRDVTEARQADLERRDSDRLLRLVSDNVPAMIAYLGADYRYRYANRSYIEFYGEGKSVEGRTALEFAGAKTWQAVEGYFVRAMAGEAVEYERTHQRRSGKLRQVEISLIPHLDEARRVLGIYVVALDVTARHRRDEALRLRDRALDASVNSVMITEQGAGGQRIAYVNPAFERMSGYAAAEVIGTNPRFLYGKELQQPGVDTLRAAVREQRDATARLRNYRKDGTLFWVEARVAPVRDDEGRVTHYVSVGSDISDAVGHEQEIERHANYDSLTGLPNRNLLNDRLAQAIVKSGRAKLPVGVMYVDLDHLKRINDSLGHAVGDAVIAALGGRLAAAVRTGDTVARVGGDEFVIVLADLKREDDAALVAAKVMKCVATPLRIEGHEFVLTASLGIAIHPKDGADPATLLRNADTALYQAKEQGRDGFRFFAAEMNERVVRFMTVERDMRKGIEANEFWLQYQPIVRLAGGEQVGSEALVRWRRSDCSVVSPADFIPVAEESGLIVPLGRWIFDSAMRHAASWNRGRSKPLFVSINLSARQFRDPMLLDTVRAALAGSKVDPSLIKLEITESAVMHDVQSAERRMGELKQLGVRISLDDFSTGYSSLAYLKRFPIDTLKLDRSFVRDLPGDSDDLAISRAVIELARGLKMDVIAEGVETREQAEVLAANGCEFAQGYFFGRPVDPGELDLEAKRRAAKPGRRKR